MVMVMTAPFAPVVVAWGSHIHRGLVIGHWLHHAVLRLRRLVDGYRLSVIYSGLYHAVLRLRCLIYSYWLLVIRGSHRVGVCGVAGRIVALVGYACAYQAPGTCTQNGAVAATQ